MRALGGMRAARIYGNGRNVRGLPLLVAGAASCRFSTGRGRAVESSVQPSRGPLGGWSGPRALRREALLCRQPNLQHGYPRLGIRMKERQGVGWGRRPETS
jgi:hypothetical protein